MGSALPLSLTAGTALGLAVAVAVTAYATVSSESQLWGPVLVAPPAPRQLALTFDDGPNPVVTPRLLEVLAARGVRATFFLIGEHVRREPALTRAIAAAGHTIGNHTMHHPWLARHTERLIRRELAECNDVLEQTLGTPVRLFRAPHGARRPGVLRAAQELGLETVQWNLIVSDWKPDPAEVLLARLERGLKRNRRRGRGTNVVLHDGGQHTPTAPRLLTVEAVRQLLERLPGETSFVRPPDWR